MKITADTNVLVRVIVRDDHVQARKALEILRSAKAVFIPLPCLCEFVWVLDSTYRLPRDKVASALRAIVARANVHCDQAAVSAGLDLHQAGSDFADGVIAAAGAAMGGETFVSFDRKAVTRIKSIGMSAELATSLA